MKWFFCFFLLSLIISRCTKSMQKIASLYILVHIYIVTIAFHKGVPCFFLLFVLFCMSYLTQVSGYIQKNATQDRHPDTEWQQAPSTTDPRTFTYDIQQTTALSKTSHYVHTHSYTVLFPLDKTMTWNGRNESFDENCCNCTRLFSLTCVSVHKYCSNNAELIWQQSINS